MNLLLSYGLPDPERLRRDGVGTQGYCSSIFLEPQGSRHRKGQSRGKIYRPNLIPVTPSVQPVSRAKTVKFLKTVGRSPSQQSVKSMLEEPKRSLG